MKKLLGVLLLTGSMIFMVPTANAENSYSASDSAGILSAESLGQSRRNRRAQSNRDRNRRANQRNDRGRNYRHRVHTVYRTRYVRYGRRLYKETYRIKYYPNGKVQTKLIRRVRVR